ncbi:SPFH domain-containing protein [Candidatus Kaiserbacteria bacterium]|nr:SPFH domain-containing protein [Candidatus Kaiserbacteria bacterium]
MSRFADTGYHSSGVSTGDVFKFGGVGLLVLIVMYGVSSLLFSVMPPAGFEAVLTDYPILFGQGGVEAQPVKAGRTFKLPWTHATLVDMRPQQKIEHFDDLMSSDGVPLDFDAAVRLQVVDSVALISRFGEDWYDRNIATEFRNHVRQSVRKHGMNETAIQTTAIDAIDMEVTSALQTYLTNASIPVQLVQVTIGRANPPDAIKDQRIQTAQQEQRKLTELRRRDAEINRKEAEEKRAAADNTYRNSLGLSPAQFIELQRIKMQGDVCGHGGCTFVVSGGPTGVIVNADKPAPKGPEVSAPAAEGK